MESKREKHLAQCCLYLQRSKDTHPTAVYAYQWRNTQPIAPYTYKERIREPQIQRKTQPCGVKTYKYREAPSLAMFLPTEIYQALCCLNIQRQRCTLPCSVSTLRDREFLTSREIHGTSLALMTYNWRDTCSFALLQLTAREIHVVQKNNRSQIERFTQPSNTSA